MHAGVRKFPEGFFLFFGSGKGIAGPKWLLLMEGRTGEDGGQAGSVGVQRIWLAAGVLRTPITATLTPGIHQSPWALSLDFSFPSLLLQMLFVFI